MAISLSTLDTATLGSGSSITSSSISPTGSRLILAIITSTTNSFATATFSVSSTFSTGGWTRVNTSSRTAPGTAIEIWHATTTASPGSGTVTCSFDAASKGANMAIVEITGGQAEIQQNAVNNGNTSTLEVTLTSTPSGLVIGAVGEGSNGTITNTITEGTGFTELLEQGSGSLNLLNVEYRTGGDTVVDWSSLDTVNNVGIAIEVTEIITNPTIQGISSITGASSITF